MFTISIKPEGTLVYTSFTMAGGTTMKNRTISGGERGKSIDLFAGLGVGVACFLGLAYFLRKPKANSGEISTSATAGPNARVIIAEPNSSEQSAEFCPCRLSLLGVPRPGDIRSRRAAACACSVLLHAAAVAAILVSASPDGHLPRLASYKVQVLHLRAADPPKTAGQLWRALHPDVTSGGRWGGRKDAGSLTATSARKAGTAPQTLIVGNASPELKLQRAVPVPMAFAIPLPAIPPQAVELRPATDLSPQPVPREPRVSVLSLPERDTLIPNATVVPVVNQNAAGGSGNEESQGRSSSTTSGLENQNATSRVLPTGRVDSTESVTLLAAASSPLSPAGTIARDGANDISGRQVPPALVVPRATRVDLPAETKPRSSLLGESEHVSGRIVGSVYLKMGLRKTWTLEYWTDNASATGLDAPWPTMMFRPDQSLLADTDALLVRGHLTAEGKLRQLALLAPTDWNQSGALFRVLEEWSFRPASRRGVAVEVELLLVIPRQTGE